MKLLSKNKQACLAFVLLSGAFLGTPSQAESKFSIADGKTTMLPFELIDNRVFVEVQPMVEGHPEPLENRAQWFYSQR